MELKQLFELLELTDYYGESELIEIAKGRNELVTTIKEKREQKKRAKLWQSRKK